MIPCARTGLAIELGLDLLSLELYGSTVLEPRVWHWRVPGNVDFVDRSTSAAIIV